MCLALYILLGVALSAMTSIAQALQPNSALSELRLSFANCATPLFEMQEKQLSYKVLEDRILTMLADPDALSSEKSFNALALEIYRFQHEHNSIYRNLCHQLNAGEELSDWRKIPAVPQSAFKHFALRTFSESLTRATFRTSGTTGEGFGSHHFRSLRLYDEAILRGWDFFNLPKDLPQIILVPSPANAPHSSLSHMMGILRVRAKSSEQHWCIDQNGTLKIDKLKALLQRFIGNKEPVLLLGTALAFLHYFEKLSDETFQLPSGSRAMETGGYKGSGRILSKAALYELFAKHLSLPDESVFNEYGMTELSSQFYTFGLNNAHRAPPWLRALVIDPETGREVKDGEIGTLRIFDLANLGSAVAIQTRDLAVQRGKSFELLGRDPAALPRGCSRTADEMLSHH